MPPATYVHHLNPFVLRLWDDVGIRWYGLSYVAGFVCAYWILYALARRGRILIKPQAVGDFIVAMEIGPGGRGPLGLGNLLPPPPLWDFPPPFPFRGLVAMLKGGMASHGGII